ncbi:ankyrin [Xylariaceae sp. AK1471]|nr:ankyrin [Xylariaceae sp. AK1471]
MIHLATLFSSPEGNFILFPWALPIMEGDTSSTVAGAMSIAALFNNCIECFDYIQLARPWDGDYERCQLKIDVIRARLCRCGRAIAINKDPHFTTRSHEDEFAKEVEKILQNIAQIFESLRKASEPYQIGRAAKDLAYFDHKGPPPRPSPVFLRLHAQLRDLPTQHQEQTGAVFRGLHTRLRDLPTRYQERTGAVFRGLHTRLRDLPTRHQEQTGTVKKRKRMLYDDQNYDFLIREIGSCVDALENLSPVAVASRNLVESETWNIIDEPSLLALKEAADGTDDALSKVVTGKLVWITQRNLARNTKRVPVSERLFGPSSRDLSSPSFGKPELEDTLHQSISDKPISVTEPRAFSPVSWNSGFIMPKQEPPSTPKKREQESNSTLTKPVLLIRALYNDDIDQIKKLISEGIDVNKPITYRDKGFLNGGNDDERFVPVIDNVEYPMLRRDRSIQNKLPIQVAATKSLKATKLLLEAGADVNKTWAAAGTALQVAIDRGPSDEVLKIVELLFDHGANVNALSAALGTALTAAVRRKMNDVLRVLLEKGSNVNQLNLNSPFTALTTAAQCNNSEAVRILLDKVARLSSLPLSTATRRW